MEIKIRKRCISESIPQGNDAYIFQKRKFGALYLRLWPTDLQLFQSKYFLMKRVFCKFGSIRSFKKSGNHTNTLNRSYKVHTASFQLSWCPAGSIQTREPVLEYYCHSHRVGHISSSIKWPVFPKLPNQTKQDDWVSCQPGLRCPEIGRDICGCWGNAHPHFLPRNCSRLTYLRRIVMTHTTTLFAVITDSLGWGKRCITDAYD